MKKIIAKFNSKCGYTGKPIRKGEECYYDPIQKKVYKLDSMPELDTKDPAAGYIQAQEEAYFDNFCQNNNI